jgi:putative peptidoglycan lipid II flippase
MDVVNDMLNIAGNEIKTNLAKAAILLTIISFLNKFLGLFRESALAAYFGATYDSDAYKLAVSIPGILLSIISASIATTFIPVYSEYVRNKTKEQTSYFVSNIFNIVTLFAIILTCIGYFITPLIVKVVANGFSNDAYILTVKLTKITMVSIVFTALYNLSCGFIQANKKFITPILAWTVYDLLVFGALVIFHKNGIVIVTYITSIAMISMLLVQLPTVMKSGYKFRLMMDFREEGVKKIARLIIPVTVSSLFNQLYIFINRMLASGLNEGSISALDYANRVNSLVYYIFIISIITVVFPDLSFQVNDINKFKKTLIKAIRIICIMALPSIALLLALRYPIIKLLFERGVFDSNDTEITSVALACYSFSIIGIGIREILNRAFYALQDTKTPVINGIVVIIVNIITSLLFVKFWGIGGLAASVSLSSILSALLLLSSLKRKIGFFDGKKLIGLLVKLLLAAIFTGVLSYYSNIVLKHFIASEAFIIQLFRICVCSTISIGSYTAFLYLLKVEDLNIILSMLKKLISKKKKLIGGQY